MSETARTPIDEEAIIKAVMAQTFVGMDNGRDNTVRALVRYEDGKLIAEKIVENADSYPVFHLETIV